MSEHCQECTNKDMDIDRLRVEVSRLRRTIFFYQEHLCAILPDKGKYVAVRPDAFGDEPLNVPAVEQVRVYDLLKELLELRKLNLKGGHHAL